MGLISMTKMTPFQKFKLAYDYKNGWIQSWGARYMVSKSMCYEFPYQSGNFNTRTANTCRKAFIEYCEGFQIGTPMPHVDIWFGKRDR